MRHFLANVVTYAIAGILIASAGVFAWLRSEQFAFTREAAVLAQYEPGSNEFRWRELGQNSYRRNCMNCHGSEGDGWDQYPGVRESASLYQIPDGKEYLLDLHIYGLASDRWRAPMPPMDHLQDVEMAAVINYLITHLSDEPLPEDASLLLPRDVAERRGRDLRPRDVVRP